MVLLIMLLLIIVVVHFFGWVATATIRGQAEEVFSRFVVGWPCTNYDQTNEDTKNEATMHPQPFKFETKKSFSVLSTFSFVDRCCVTCCSFSYIPITSA